ncbi:MAG: serine/threonine protein kinase [Opitutaceae bacterium]|nr:serine/threonine protein kinase [Opitutaceae bacterium]
MSAWDHEMERALFDAALGFADEAARHRFLDTTCGDDPALKARLIGLLAEHARAATFFDFEPTSSTRLEPAPDAGLAAGTPSGTPRYRIIRPLGEGGSGTVTLAEQTEPVRRQVALKILRRGMNSARTLARFGFECSALARMNHPNIARVFDAGSTDDGRPFFAMELVAGERITRYCENSGASLEARVRLFLQVCHGVQHAHQKGIIHRDLKPSNVLVEVQDGIAVPKIIDFGIAKVIADPDADEPAPAAPPFSGTPSYMSPEQADGTRTDEDTRSDVYGLGALLYEMLLGRAPFDARRFDAGDVAEIQRVLRDEMPARPSAVVRELDGGAQNELARKLQTTPRALLATLRDDLDWIVLKALAKDRQQRYATVQGLAVDLQRYLDDESVSARPPSTRYRVRKALRRHRVGFIATSAVLLALVAGLGTSTWLYMREREALRIQRQLREEAEDALKITHAVYLARDNQLEAANALLAGISRPPDRPSFEGVTVYRLIGDWLASQKRWRETADRFSIVQRFGALDGWSQVTRDHQSYGVALLAAQDTAGYERFREEHARRFSQVENGDAVGRVLKICLLRPAEGEMAARLHPLGQRVDAWFTALPVEHAREWATIPVALWRFRQGDFSGAADAARRGLDPADHASSCTATQRLLLALCDFQIGATARGREQLDIARADIARIFSANLPPGGGREGFWYDWLFARLLLEEAEKASRAGSG